MRLIVLLLATLLCGVAFAQEAAEIVQPSIPMLKEVLMFLQGIPGVGPYLKLALEIMASIAVFFTAAVAFVKAILSIAYFAAKPFSAKLATSIDLLEKKVIPWLKYLSMMNADKKELEKSGIPKVMI